MPRGGYRPGAGRPPGAKNKKAPERAAAELRKEAEEAGVELGEFADPKDFLAALMNSSADVRLRADAAKALMPYVHVRKGEGGKKDAEADAAKTAAGGGAFTARPAPTLKRVS